MSAIKHLRAPVDGMQAQASALTDADLDDWSCCEALEKTRDAWPARGPPLAAPHGATPGTPAFALAPGSPGYPTLDSG